MRQASAVILAGGRSSRMGKNKALLKIENKSIIQTQVDELRKYYAEVIIIGNEPELYRNLEVRVVKDLFPGLGPLAGIQAGLTAASNDWIFVLPCDMPFVPASLGLRLLDFADGADGVVLQKDGHLEPLCALYNKRCLGAIEEFLKSDRRKVIDFYPLKKIKIIPLELLGEKGLDKALFNINTPEEYKLAQELLEASRKMK